MIWLIPYFSILLSAVGCILLGYWMGRNSRELPMVSSIATPTKDQGSQADPGGDPFEEAMAEQEEPRVPTIGDLNEPRKR